MCKRPGGIELSGIFITSLMTAVDACTLASSATPALDGVAGGRHRVMAIIKTAKALLRAIGCPLSFCKRFLAVNAVNQESVLRMSYNRITRWCLVKGFKDLESARNILKECK
jgi:hypothetical protein